MITVYREIDDEQPFSARTVQAVREAAAVIRRGGLVAFPTETVYGLGANAYDADAVLKIFAAKNRPADNPLIVHVAEKKHVEEFVQTIPPLAQHAMDQFWPGPLTLVLRKKGVIPYETSGGLETVAVRMPQNPAARFLIQEAGVPVAAPSANPSGRPSPTNARHVQDDQDGRIDMVLDGGSTRYGLESTVVDMSGDVPCLLRPGSVTWEMLRDALGDVRIDPALQRFAAHEKDPGEGNAPKAPGMKYSHYSPLAEVTVVTGTLEQMTEKINRLALCSVKKTGILATDQTERYYDPSKAVVISLGDRNRPESIGARLFEALRLCDWHGVEEVYAESFPETEIGLAIMDRLRKAAGYKIV